MQFIIIGSGIMDHIFQLISAAVRANKKLWLISSLQCHVTAWSAQICSSLFESQLVEHPMKSKGQLHKRMDKFKLKYLLIILHGIAISSLEEYFFSRIRKKFAYHFFRIHKRFAYHCIKQKSLSKHITHFYQASKEIDLTQLQLDHPSKIPLVSILHKRKQPIPIQRCDLGNGLAPSWLPGRALSNGREERVIICIQ